MDQHVALADGQSSSSRLVSGGRISRPSQPRVRLEQIAQRVDHGDQTDHGPAQLDRMRVESNYEIHAHSDRVREVDASVVVTDVIARPLHLPTPAIWR